MEPAPSFFFRSRNAVHLAVLAATPLAYLGAIWLGSRLPRQDLTVVQRDTALAAVTRFAAARHIDTAGWRPYLAGVHSERDELALVLRHAPSPLLESVATPVPLHVLMQSPDSRRWLRATVTPRGRVVDFQQNDPPGETRPVDEAAARTMAEGILRQRLGPDTRFALAYKNVRSTGAGGQRRTFTWQSRVPGLNQARVEFFVQMFSSQVVHEGAEVTFDDDYLASLSPYRQWTQALSALGAIYVAILGVYALIRYIRRATEKEVSHRRTLLIALGFVTLAGVTIYGDPGALSANQSGQPFQPAQLVATIVVMALSMSLVGAFMGIAYGAGEGALREAYPGKLTSLDALLAGRVFSANVARSILVGGCFAGWALLAQNAALLAAHGAREVTQQTLTRAAYSPVPLLYMVMDIGTDALLLMTFGLLLPFAFLRPKMRRRWLFYALLAGVSVLCAALVASGLTAQNFVIGQVVLVAVTYAPFFYSDLLAATAGIFALRFVGTLGGLSAVAESWKATTFWIGAAGLVFLAAELYFARRGRVYHEWEVRPRYARFLAEHLSMQAEIGAARQAQVRLLPDAPPHIAGLSIAGSCVPSREVGGDFFDFYPLDDHRLGVFLAEGGNRQLGAAMTIALAKGYLLYATRLDHSPAEILRRLRDLLGVTFRGDASEVSMLYAIVDARARIVRYARTGVSPRMLINGNEAAEETAGGHSAEKSFRLGAATLAPNDALVFYSDGFEGQIAARKRQPVGRYLAKIIRDIRSGSAADLHAVLLQDAIRKKNEQPPDDVTAVVVRLRREAEQAIEVVA